MQAQRSWDEEWDVLVVGSGGGGLTGAYTAAREGLSVLLAEAADRFGGTTAYSGGGMWFPCNAVLGRAGDDDTLDEAREYFHAVVGDRTPRDLQDAFLDTGAPLVDYLEADGSFEFAVFPWPDYFGSAPRARPGGRHIMAVPLAPEALGPLRRVLRPPLATERAGHPPPDELVGGQALVGRLLLALSRLPAAELRAEAECAELVRENGRVAGAVLHQRGGARAVRARRGVLVAAGGFERNSALRSQFGVPGSVEGAMGPPSNLGRPIEAAMRIGADTDLMSEAWWAPGLVHPDGTSTFSLWFTGGIFVDDRGRRFVNESWPYDRIGREVIGSMRAGTLTLPFWMVYDDRDGGLPPVGSASVPLAAAQEYAEAGLRFTGATVAELAGRIGVPAEELVREVERFNAFAERGVDEDFRRGDEPYDRAFAGPGSPLVPLVEGPFHAAAFGLSDLGTKGGLRTDARARVLDTGGRVIPGLYAAGNSMAAVSGATYPAGGNPIGASMVFSHLAALDMAAVSRGGR